MNTKAVFILILLLYLLIPWSSGQSLLDSLNTQLQQEGSDEEKVDLLTDISWELMNSDIRNASRYINESISLAQGISYKEGLAKAYKTKGVIAWYQGDMPVARSFFQIALNHYEELNDLEGVANTVNNLGLAYQATEDYTKSLNKLKESLAIREEIGDKAGIATSCNNIGVLYFMTGAYEKSLDFHMKALELRNQLGDRKNSAHSYLNLGRIYMLLASYEKALSYFEQGLLIHKEVKNMHGVADAYSNLGDVKLEMDEFTDARGYLFRALNIREELEDQSGIRESLSSIGKALMLKGNYKEAIKYHRRAVTVSENAGEETALTIEFNHLGELYLFINQAEKAIPILKNSILLSEKVGAKPELSEAHFLLSKAYASQNEYLLAYQHQSMHLQVKDSILNEKKAEDLLKLQMEFETEKQEKEIVLLKKEKSISKLQQIGLIILFIALLLCGISWFLYYRYRTQSKTSQQLYEQKLLIEERNQALELSNADLEQFAYVVSHDLQQPLRTIGSFVGLIERRYQAILDTDGLEFMEFVTQGVTQMHLLLKDLLHYSQTGKKGEAQLVDMNLALQLASKNLEQMIRETNSKIHADPLPFIIGNQSGLIQLFQNLISNAIKFRKSGRSQIEIIYKDEPYNHLIMVKDNGIGIKPEYQEKIFEVFQRLHPQSIPGTGIGLAICQKVVKQHGGDIWVESNYGHGCTFSIRLPKG